MKDDKQYSRVVGTMNTHVDDNEGEVDPNADVQTLDGADDDVNANQQYYNDNGVTSPDQRNQSAYGKVGTQSTTDRKRLGNNDEYN